MKIHMQMLFVAGLDILDKQGTRYIMPNYFDTFMVLPFIFCIYALVVGEVM